MSWFPAFLCPYYEVSLARLLLLTVEKTINAVIAAQEPKVARLFTLLAMAAMRTQTNKKMI